MQIERTAHTRGGTSSVNEDRATAQANSAWVLDGTSGVSRPGCADAPSDGAWYVDRLDAYLQDHIEDFSRSLPEILRAAITEITQERVEQLADETTDWTEAVSHQGEPAAQVALTRWTDEYIEYLNLGDCVHLFTDADNEVTRVMEATRLQEIDAETLRQIDELADSYNSFDAIRAELDSQIAAGRDLMNTPDGFWVASFNPFAAQMAETGRLARGEVSSMYLFSDGFDRLVERYNIFSSWSDAVTALQDEGIPDIIETLRTFEETHSVKEVPRNKPSDDVGIAHVRFP